MNRTLDAQIVFERPYIAHSSLPIYGSDKHLRRLYAAKPKPSHPTYEEKKPQRDQTYHLSEKIIKTSVKTVAT